LPVHGAATHCRNERPWAPSAHLERPAVDISATGRAFYVEEPPTTGSPIKIALGNLLEAEADVLACQEVPLQILRDPPRYRVHSQFTDEEQGLRMLVAIKEMEDARANAD
jgi:hypothetical protein